jgi:hypothetical protein
LLAASMGHWSVAPNHSTAALRGQKTVCMYRAPEKPSARISVMHPSFFRVANPKKPHNIRHAKAVKPCWGLLMLVRGVFQRHPTSSSRSILPTSSARSILPTSNQRSILQVILQHSILLQTMLGPLLFQTMFWPLFFRTMFWPLFFRTMFWPLFFRTMFGPLVEAHRSQTKACIDRSRIGR